MTTTSNPSPKGSFTAAFIEDYVDEAWYLSAYPFVRHLGLSASEHFLRFGLRQGLSPNSVSGPVSLPAMDQLTRSDQKRLENAGVDPDFYLKLYPEVARAGHDPFDHYRQFGSKWTLRPNGLMPATSDVLSEARTTQFCTFTLRLPSFGRTISGVSFKAIRISARFAGADEFRWVIGIDFGNEDQVRRNALFGLAFPADGCSQLNGSVAALACQIPKHALDLKIELDLEISAKHPSSDGEIADVLSIETSLGHVGYIDLRGPKSTTETDFPYICHVSAAHQIVGMGVQNKRPDQIDTLTALNNVTFRAGVKPTVSIVILNYNKAKLSVASANALQNTNISHPYEVLIVDNGSEHDDVLVLQANEGPYRLLKLSKNRFFGEGNNLGAEHCHGEFLLFLNNDAFLQTGAVDEMLRAFSEAADCGAVGPVFRYPDGRLQEAGAFVRTDGTAIQRGKFDPEVDVDLLPRFGRVDYVSAACLLIRTKDFFSLGGFHHRFDPAYYEDTDLNFKLRTLAKRVYLARDALCVHVENATTGDPKHRSNAHLVVERNREMFLSIWKDFLATRRPNSLPKIKQATKPRDMASNDKLENAVFTPFPILPGGGERYIFGCGVALANFGPTAAVTPDPYSVTRLKNTLSELALPDTIEQCVTLEEVKQVRLKRFISMENYLLPQYPALGEMSFYHCQFPFSLDRWSQEQINQGFDFLSDFRAVVVNSRFTAQAYRRQAERWGVSLPVHIINPPVATHKLVAAKRQTSPMILSVGRFTSEGHSKRQDIILRAYLNTSKQFQAEWSLVLAGNVSTSAKSIDFFTDLQKVAGDHPNIHFVVSPDQERLTELYLKASVYVHATGYGVHDPSDYEKCEHFGITIVEALAAGCTTLAYELGGPLEIFNTTGQGQTYSDIDHLTALLEASQAPKDNRAARKRIGQLYSDAAFSQQIQKLFDTDTL